MTIMELLAEYFQEETSIDPNTQIYLEDGRKITSAELDWDEAGSEIMCWLFTTPRPTAEMNHDIKRGIFLQNLALMGPDLAIETITSQLAPGQFLGNDVHVKKLLQGILDRVEKNESGK